MSGGRSLALILALVITAGLAGCGQTAAPQPTGSSPGSLTTPSPTAAESSVPETTPELIPTPDPTPEPTPDPVLEKLRAMTLEEKVAQMLVVKPETLAGVVPYATQAGELTRAGFQRIPVGGVFYAGENLQDPEQVRQMCANMQEISRERIGLPVFLCVDEEGGTVARVSGTGRFGVEALPSMCLVGDTGDPEQAEQIGRSIGRSLAGLGLNVDFAPVADVLTEPQNQVVRYRSFGSDPKLVTEMCRACAQGMLEEGVWPTYKHFPGHGSTVGDSHEGFALSNRTREELLSSELMPFADAASAGIPFIMSGHISFPNVTGDTAPASLSGELLTGLLREELGYDGILITDALNMGAVVQNYSIAQSAVMAVQAGNDMLLIFNDMDAYYQALLEAVRQGEIGEERIDESVERILRLKMG